MHTWIPAFCIVTLIPLAVTIGGVLWKAPAEDPESAGYAFIVVALNAAGLALQGLILMSY